MPLRKGDMEVLDTGTSFKGRKDFLEYPHPRFEEMGSILHN